MTCENTCEDAVRDLAPCGLSCARCLAFVGGPVQEHAAALLDALTNFERHAGRFAAFDPVFAHYGEFQALAGWFAKGRCRGCRSGECLHGGCRVGACARERGVDFCFRCADFPCADSGLEEPLRARWIAMNRAMAEKGPENFHRESLTKPRY
ncbi:Protein of unknown function DUF3795 [Desulfovibrio sp. X2]|uniref:DUF3795 domain-containing protein n=1 Tax=Desulfovibrio sp. X2 TaxID=941449 RepID=UPI000358D6CC|nr:DUF3795 domain-containing protein [Desulfovibrio sp. X2]EPR37083.1 Protein of unknown function DUF3795 [Desulfovibrio sp. X2]